MRNTSKIKRVLALCLIFLMSINSFAASDNDGSAFITKAEFDSLKNNFQSQIDNYNQSIDSKIDSAIASYLSGISVSKTVKRSKLCDAETWMMWPNNDYPTYVEGYPYVHGTCAKGNWIKRSATSSSENNTWASIILEGDPAFQANGGFKKHFVVSPSKNRSLNGNDDYGAEYIGYYVNEGEDIIFGGWEYSLASSFWAADGENEPKFTGENTFGAVSLPYVCYPNFQIWLTSKSYCTDIRLVIQAAQRIPGDLASGTNVSIYNDIYDNRFYERDVQNMVGINNTDPEIASDYKGATWCAWFDKVCPTKKDNYASFCIKDWDGTQFKTTNHMNSYSYTMVGTKVSNNNHLQSLCKLSNDGNNLQFARLWTADTNAVASMLLDIINDPSTTSYRKYTIEKGLIYDKDGIAHVTMGAGYPFLKVAKDEEVEWSFKVNGSNDCRLVAKYGPFDIATDAESQADVEFTNITTGDKKVFIGKHGEKNTIKFKATEDGIVFLKWKSNTATLAKTELDVSEVATVKLKEE